MPSFADPFRVPAAHLSETAFTRHNIYVHVFNSIWMSGSGFVAIGYGLLNKQMRFRDGTKIKPGWQSLLARAWFIILGADFWRLTSSDQREKCPSLRARVGPRAVHFNSNAVSRLGT